MVVVKISSKKMAKRVPNKLVPVPVQGSSKLVYGCPIKIENRVNAINLLIRPNNL